MTLDIQYSVVVPLFNEEELIAELYSRLKETMTKVGSTYELIFVDDGSSDMTCHLLNQYALEDHNVMLVKLSRNFGQESAILAGIKYSQGQEIVLMDGDLQDEPEFIPEMIKKKSEGYKVVYSVKKERKEQFLIRFLTKVFYKFMHLLCNMNMPMNAGTFSIFDRDVGESLYKLPECNKYISGLRFFLGYRQVGLPYERRSRKKGKSKSLDQLIRMGLNAFFSFSIFPLRMAITIGLLINLFSFLAVLFFLITGREISVDSLLVSLFIITNACILIQVIMIEYILRTNIQVKGRPDFIAELRVLKGQTETIKGYNK